MKNFHWKSSRSKLVSTRRSMVLSLSPSVRVPCLELWGRCVEQKLTLSCSFVCDHIHNIGRFEFGHNFLVPPKSDLDVEQTHLQGLRKRGSLISEWEIYRLKQKDRQIDRHTHTYIHTHTYVHTHTHTWAKIQKHRQIELRRTTMCDPIHNNDCYEFDHT
jgi:hypothetical protein